MLIFVNEAKVYRNYSGFVYEEVQLHGVLIEPPPMSSQVPSDVCAIPEQQLFGLSAAHAALSCAKVTVAQFPDKLFGPVSPTCPRTLEGTQHLELTQFPEVHCAEAEQAANKG